LAFFFAVTCFKPFDSERCSELDLTELVETAEVDCDDDFSDVFAEVDLFSEDEFTLEDWDTDSSIVELLIVAEAATTLDFALELLVKLFETSVVFEDSALETEDFFELVVFEVETAELFLLVELALAVD